MMAQFGFSQVGINTTSPQALLDIKSSNQVTPSNTDGILIPKMNAFPITNPTAAQNSMLINLTTTSAGKPPGFYYWDQPSTSWKGFNADGAATSKYYTVLGTTNVSAPSFSGPMAEMTQTFTPNSDVVFVQFAAAGCNNEDVPNLCSYVYGVGFTILLDGIPVKSIQTPIINNTWDLNFMYPITVTSGIPHTVSVNWHTRCPASIVYNYVNTPQFGREAYRSLTITDPNGGGSIVVPPVTTNLWGVNGNSGTNFLGTTDNKDLIFKSGFVGAGHLNVYNTSFGRYSTPRYTSGIYNTAFGRATLISNTNGQYNTGVGGDVLSDLASGEYNTAIGAGSMSFDNYGGFNDGGSQNAAYGRNALEKLSISMNYNTATGMDAMYSIDSENNTATGHSALYNSSSYNTPHGSRKNNTAVGFSSLHGGLFSDFNFSGSIGMGYQAGDIPFFNDTMGVNKLYIENSNSTTPLIYGEFDTDLVKINGNFRVKSTSIVSAEMQVKNSNLYNHSTDNNLNFSTGGGYFMMSTQDASPSSETAGISGVTHNVSIWSPGDGARQLRILDEDNWNDNNGNPYDNGAEVAYIASNGQYFQVSDKNKKENIVKIEKASDKISQISGYTYQYKLNKQEIEKGQKPVSASGVLAQEIEQILPEAIQKNESVEYFVDYAAITPLLIEAIKDKAAKIKSLEVTNAEILNRLKKLEEK